MSKSVAIYCIRLSSLRSLILQFCNYSIWILQFLNCIVFNFCCTFTSIGGQEHRGMSCLFHLGSFWGILLFYRVKSLLLLDEYLRVKYVIYLDFTKCLHKNTKKWELIRNISRFSFSSLLGLKIIIFYKIWLAEHVCQAHCPVTTTKSMIMSGWYYPADKTLLCNMILCINFVW